MNRLNEDSIEKLAIEQLESLGYSYIYAPNIAPDGDAPERASYDEVVLKGRLQRNVDRINPSVPAEARQEAIKEVLRISSPELLANNEAFHRLLTEGVKVNYQKDGQSRGDLVWLIDFDQPDNNEFVVANQFTVIENGVNKRPDVILFVNGIPLVVLELKNAVDEKATITSAYKQIGTYKQAIPGLFTYNAFCVISDGLEAKTGTVSSDINRFMAWKSMDGKVDASKLIVRLRR